jgi:cytochrome c5
MEREIIMRSKHLLLAVAVPAIVAPAIAVLTAAVLTPAQALAQAATPSQTKAAPPSKKPAAAHATQQYEGDGERIFKENCSRCHNAPEGFSPHISGTIVRHMRVRASLSEHDEQELLRFFNP